MTVGPVSRQRWAVLEPLLDAALELEPTERQAFLDGACAGDRALRAEIRALLAACELGDTILARPAVVEYAPLLTDPAFPLPTLLGNRYRIVREIAQGGMSTVYLAEDPKHGRLVAVKVLQGDVAHLVGQGRFMREIEIAAGLSHPHILPLHDSGEVPPSDDGEPSFLYFVSPYVSGESLRDRLQREPRLPADDAVRLGREIALALDYAHRRGVVHLDIKPGNILLQDGHAVVADFGIARAMSAAGDDASRGPTPLLGTPSYMSPEQALGAFDLDGRSDVYSLGCVLYEMLAGERPFTPETSADAIARARAPSPPDPAPLHRCVSRELAAVVLRAMARERDDRFSTAGDLARALSDATRPPRTPVVNRTRIVTGLALAVVAAAVGMWTMRGSATLDPDLIVVAPFDAEAPSLELWKEGMVDVMSRNLDGAGPLRTVPATMAVKRWRGRADAQSARALATVTGARLVLFGGLLAAGDSVRATAVLLDASDGHVLGEFERRDVADRVDRLSDSLTVAVLRELSRSRRLDMARATSSPSASLPALKSYLQGEQFYRAAMWDSAQTRFERVLALDSSFALAYHRLAQVRRWRNPDGVPDSMAYALMQRTSRFARGLAPRERLLATIDSLSAEAYFAWRRGLRDVRTYDEAERTVGRLIAAVGDGLVRYRHDAELLFLLAETRWRYDRDFVEGGLDDREILELYDHAIAMDSTFAPAYVTPISLAAYLDGAESARRYIRAYLSRAPSGDRARVIRVADLLLDPARAASIDAAHLVDTASANELCEATTLLRHIPDSAEVLVRIASVLARNRADSTYTRPEPACAMIQATEGLQFRGHLREAQALTSVGAGLHWLAPTVTYNLARFGMLPTDTVRAEFRAALALSPRSKNVKLYRWWATDGDTLAINTYIRDFGTSKLGSASGRAMIRASIAAGRAYLALARRDTASALRQLLTTPDTLHECWYDNRVTLVQLLMAKGRYQEAAARLERRWPGTTGCSNGLDDVVWTMERARVLERLGRHDEAVANYAFVADAWRTADAELQPWVREAHNAMARLRVRTRSVAVSQ
ncbi:MAG TPA: serine/threonine-protein kinase [Gemmatimonadaceae bacterium]|nr:serine/threonine-protein kinase [Gemmatimonadaceae bacterium]